MLPAVASRLDLARDYDGMQVMLFGTPPEFSEILGELRKLEADINGSARTTDVRK